MTSVKLCFFLVLLLAGECVFANEGQYAMGQVRYKNTDSTQYKGFQELDIKTNDSISDTQLAAIRQLHVGITCKDKNYSAVIKESAVANHHSVQVVRCKKDGKADKDEKKAAIVNHQKILTDSCAGKDGRNWPRDPVLSLICAKYTALKK